MALDLTFKLERVTLPHQEAEGGEKVRATFTIEHNGKPCMLTDAGDICEQTIAHDESGRPLPSNRFGPRVISSLAKRAEVRKGVARMMSRLLIDCAKAAGDADITVAGKRVEGLSKPPTSITDANGVKIRNHVYAAVKAAMPADVLAE